MQVDSARTASATLGPAGGTVVATAADGRRYTLTVEPGALAAATEITATPVLSMGSAPLAAGLKGAVRFGPAGLRFALPATLRIEGADPTASAGSTLVGFLRSADGTSMQLVPPTVTASAIEMEVRHFSDVGASQATTQDLAQVPVDPNETPEEALLREFVSGIFATPDDAAALAFVVRLHDTRVAPRLTVAELRTVATDTEREEAILVASAWMAMALDSFEVLPASLEPLLTALRQRVLAILTEDFEAGRTACMGPAPIGSAHLIGLQNALRARAQVGLFRKVGGLPGLDADTVARRLNDCVRVVFEPRTLPSFEIGRPVSLDMRAQLVFAADPNASIQVPFEFDVFTSTARFGAEFFVTGFSDAQGSFTAVATPTEANPQFDVEACMVVNLRNGGPIGSALCGRQTLRGGAPAPVVLQGLVTANVVITATLRGNRDRVESFEGLLPVFDTTSELVDVTLAYGVSMPVPAGTVVQPGARTSLPDAAVSNLSGSGQARVDSQLQARTGSCVITRLGTAGTSVTLATPQAPGGALELTDDGQLGITIGGLQGTYVTTSAGSLVQTNSVGCSTPGTFNSPFGPRPVASEFLTLADARATTALPSRGNTTAASSTFAGSVFFSTSACNNFAREHLRLLEPRLLSSEHIVSCTQQTTLSWQLQRE
ncbi:MAG: hypothetical protein V4569_17425 [Pseudomonadota bacterium]